jgi:hypothetical protein
MNKIINWLIITVIGFSVMLFSFLKYQRFTEDSYWKDTLLYIGKGEPNEPAEDLQYVPVSVYLLKPSALTELFYDVIQQNKSELKNRYEMQTRQKIILFPQDFTGFKDSMLQTGRLPEPGTSEVLAGCQAIQTDKIVINNSELKIVGRLKRTVELLAESLVLYKNAESSEIFKEDELYNGFLVKFSEQQKEDEKFTGSLKSAFPKNKFTPYTSWLRTRPTPFFFYIAGMSVLLFGGTFLFFNIYKLSAGIFKNTGAAHALQIICEYKYLFFSVHLASFGLCLLFMVFVYYLPEVQYFLTLVVHSEISSGSGPLAVAGKAYMSENILSAAVVTFVINFLIGSLLFITIPSILIPGSGILMVLFRSAMWGLILSPSLVRISTAMVPHSITLLLEGEAYILAAFFGLLMLIFLFRKSHGEGLAQRYKNAFIVNMQGIILIAIILAIAALYEAVEVILMVKMRG